MHAVIEANGRQVLVRAGDTIQLEGTGSAIGDEVTFDRVLACGDQVGTPFVDGARVKGRVVFVGRGPKIYVQHFRRRKNYRRRTGFRAAIYRVEITELES